MALTVKVQRTEKNYSLQINGHHIKVSLPVIPGIFHHILPQLRPSLQAFFSLQPVEKNTCTCSNTVYSALL